MRYGAGAIYDLEMRMRMNLYVMLSGILPNTPMKGILFLHVLLGICIVLRMKRLRFSINAAHLLWMLVLPIFGPVAGWVMISSTSKLRQNGDPVIMGRADGMKPVSSLNTRAEEIIPLEDALSINTPKLRREMILSILREDPMKHVELLLAARGNDDTETAHYAASTIMELQRQIQSELRRLQQEAENAPDIDKHRAYITLLQRYCESGMVNGQFLQKQRVALQDALVRALEIEECYDLLNVEVCNALALRHTEAAKQAAHRMLELRPTDEESWLAGIRVAVETRDARSAQVLLRRMDFTRVDWSRNGRERISIWKEELA